MRVLLFLALLAASLALVSANTCGGNCPSNNCPGCPCGTAKAPVNIANACAQFSGWNQEQCRCVVQHESAGNGHAANYNAGGRTYDIGVWQINTINWASCSGGNPPCDMASNLRCAIAVWRWGGGSFKLWSTCGGCRACAVSEEEQKLAINPDWNGEYPEWYDATEPFPEWALNTTDVRILPQKPKHHKIVLTEQ